MAIAEDHRRARPPRATPATLRVVVPVFNEEVDLEPSVRGLRSYLDDRFPLPVVITPADNASNDRTWDIATRLAGEVPGVRAVHVDHQGRGDAVIAIGGFNGTDPLPSLAQIQQLVREGKIHYFVADGGLGSRRGAPGGGPGRSARRASTSTISNRVTQNFAATTVGGITVHDLTVATSAGSLSGGSALA